MTFDFSLAVAARTLWQEARSENADGRRAVAHVFWNRLRSKRYGSTLASVCLWHFQFSGWRSVDPNFVPSCALADSDPLLLALAAIVVAAETEPDPTGGATLYYSPAAMPKKDGVPETPPWVSSSTYVGTFGSQRFYRGA